MLPRRCVFLCLLLLLLVPGVLVAQTTFSTVVVFGDSLSDTGNVAHLTQAQYGIRFPADNKLLGLNYTDGRFTDGTDTQPAASAAYKGVWVEQLATLFGSGVTVKDSLDGGTNYAYGDATTANGTTTESRTLAGQTFSLTVENMGQQVTDYLATNPTPSASTLYVLWGGSNDLLQAASGGQDPVAAAQTAAANELALIQRLRGAGATNFLVPNVPPLGAFAGTDTTAVTALNQASAAFAQALTTGLNGLKQGAMGATLNVYQPDILTLFAAVSTNPSMYGLGDISTAAQGVASSPDTYLIWDGLHPTTTGHHLAAAASATLLSPLVASSAKLTAPAAVVAGSSIAATAVVTSGKNGVVPTGLVTLFNQGNQVVGSAALDATGSATISFAPVAGSSSLALSAVYAGDVVNLPSASSVQPVAELAAAVTTTTTVSSTSLNADLGQSVTLTATVTPAVSSYGTPSGTVTFFDGTTSLGTGTLSAGAATLTTTSLAAGTHTITAQYMANGLFAGSTSASISEVITAPGFTAAASPTTLSVASGASGTVSLSATAMGGFANQITVSCGSLPAHFACSFDTTTLSFGSGATTTNTATLTLATNAATTNALLNQPALFGAPRVLSACLALPGALGLLLVGRRRRRGGLAGLWLTLVLGVVATGTLLGLSGCGGSGSNNAPAGSYTVPVVFTPISLSNTTGGTPAAQTVNVTVTVR